MRPIKSNKSWCVEFEDELQREAYETDSMPRSNSAKLASDLRSLLDTNPSESAVQDFLERHPRCLPETGFYHNGIRADVVVAKLPLHNDFITDFAYLSVNSQNTRVTCVEIERPGMKIFRRDGDFSAEYLHARQQVIDWNQWAQHNVKDALKYFGRYGQYLEIDPEFLRIHCILIAGRRSHITTRKQKQRWSAESATLPRTISVMTYDRLLDSCDESIDYAKNNKLLVCSYRDRALKVKYVTS